MADKIQRRVNKALRPFRRVLREDSYLQDRFYLNQLRLNRDPVEEALYFQFEIEDTKTGKKKTSHWFSEYDFHSGMPRSLFSMCNNFIALTLAEEKKNK